jgi:hypothetical protein
VKRRTFKRLQSQAEAQHHHCVYVVLLNPEVRNLRKVREANPNHDPAKPCVYVGMTGLSPADRFNNHKNGIKSAYWVKKFGIRLMPGMYEHLNPMPYEAAAQMEKELAEELKQEGYTVMGGI